MRLKVKAQIANGISDSLYKRFLHFIEPRFRVRKLNEKIRGKKPIDVVIVGDSTIPVGGDKTCIYVTYLPASGDFRNAVFEFAKAEDLNFGLNKYRPEDSLFFKDSWRDGSSSYLLGEDKGKVK